MTDNFIGHFKLWEGYKKAYPTIGPRWKKSFDLEIAKTPSIPKQSKEGLEDMTDPYGHKEKRKRPEDKPVKQEEKINHPKHYGGGDDPYETIKVLEAKLTYDEFIGFCKGNAIKYLDRANHKEFPLIDYKKSEWYVNRMNEYIKRKDAE